MTATLMPSPASNEKESLPFLLELLAPTWRTASDKSVSREERIPSLDFFGTRRAGAVSVEDAFGARVSGDWGTDQGATE